MMNTSRKSADSAHSRSSEAGNAMIYILIAVVLFAALTMMIARQGDNSESGAMDTERAEIAATQIIQTSMQLKQGIDVMMYSGSERDPNTANDDLIFTTPDDEPAFSTPPNTHKVFHPAGGGLILQPIPPQAVHEVSTNPPARWYVGRFINVEWSSTAAQEVILTAHQISLPVCRAINQKLLGDPTPLTAIVNPRTILIDGSVYSGANPVDWTNANCPTCVNKISGCMVGPSEIPGENIYSFYSIVLSR